MKYIEIKDKSRNELLELLKAKKMELFQLKIKKATMQLQKTSEIRDVRRTIARIKTALNEKKVGNNGK